MAWPSSDDLGVRAHEHAHALRHVQVTETGYQGGGAVCVQASRFLLGGVGGRRKNDGDLEEGSQRELGWYAAAAALSHRLEHACLCIERPKEISALGALKRRSASAWGRAEPTLFVCALKSTSTAAWHDLIQFRHM